MASFSLPSYPPISVRSSLSPTQLATLNGVVSSALLTTLALPAAKRDTPASRAFLASFTKDAALGTLESLIWEQPTHLSRDEQTIRKRAFLLAEHLASSSVGLDLQTLVDLAIVYAKNHPSRLRGMFTAALKSSPSILLEVENDLIPAFVQLLEPNNSSGLYGLRKTLHCILSFLQCAPDELVASFTRNKQLLLSLAISYDSGLHSIALSYGGLSALRRNEGTDLDDWERIWIACKAAIVDIFHIIMSNMVKSISNTARSGITVEADRAFDLIFALLELPSASLQSSDIPTTPFLNRSLLADFQHSYDLSSMLSSAMKQVEERDARLDILDSALGAFAVVSSIPGRDPGVLRFILHSSGAAPGIDNLGKGPSKVADSKRKGKAKATEQPLPDPELDLKVTQVLDILPDHPPEYIRDLLTHPDFPYRGNAEKVIEALLEGTAPPPENLKRSDVAISQTPAVDEFEEYLGTRRNVFDDEVMDASQLRTGKKVDDAPSLRDRSFIEEMKADILRRAEEMSDDEDEVVDDAPYDPELDEAAGVKVVGDGEESGGEDLLAANEEESAPATSPETVLELAYIRDPKLFDRDSITRRSRGREELKKQTGWDDNQIEGWRIMLERDPKKDKILQKHEFSGNQRGVIPGSTEPSGGSSQRGGRGGRGRGGRGRGGGGGGERKWKEKNKATSANNNRKRGHDKKMARAGGPS